MERHFLHPLLASPKASHSLINAERGAMIATRIDTAFDSARRRAGLLGRPGLARSAALVIAPCNAVHTFGMQFPIDVLFVNRAGQVLKRVVALRRSRIAWCFRAFAVVECAASHSGVADTVVGDTLEVVPGLWPQKETSDGTRRGQDTDGTGRSS